MLLYQAVPGLLGSQRQTTNDAFVAADFTLVAPRVAGFIKEVLVEDNQRVKAGQLLALIDDRDFRAAAQAADADTLVAQAQLKNATATLERQSSVITQAQATVAAERAEVAFAEHELNRYNHLAGVGAGTVQNAQQARTRIDQATARLTNATAVLAAERKQVEILSALRDAAAGGLKRAQAASGNGQLSVVLYAHRRAGGWHGRRARGAGRRLCDAGQQDPRRGAVGARHTWWLSFQETQLSHMRAGQAVQVRVDSLDGELLDGHLESLAPATGVTFAAVKAGRRHR